MSFYDYLLVIDFEATCVQKNNKEFYPHEIIEFPCHLLHVQTGLLVAHFHSYVKPILNPVLSNFCKELTGITQEDVDRADTYDVVEARFLSFIRENIPPDKSFIVLTDGSWDISKFMALQFILRGHLDPSSDNELFPQWAEEWIDLKKIYMYNHRSRYMKLEEMMHCYGLTFQGRLHRGYDDAFNIAQLALTMMRGGCSFFPNGKITSPILQVLKKELLGYIKLREKQRAAEKRALLLRSTQAKSRNEYSEKRTSRINTVDMNLHFSMDIDPDLHGSESIIFRKRTK